MEIQKATSSNYVICYHIIWVTKYRRQVLNTTIRKSLDTIIRTICNTKDWNLVACEAMPDHIHVFLSVSPFEKPVDIIKILKGVTAKQLFAIHPELRDVLKYGHLWSPSYYIGTAGHVSAETIERYINEQQSKDGRYKNE
jgi:putative transposase